MNKFYKKIGIYNKLNYNIQNIILNKLFEKQKKWNKIAINESIKAMHKRKWRFLKPSIVKKIEIMYT
tara:strand:+ start:987 stop:1187 length:201 start_codon:yes stop_codon:yes gene_type:complete